MVIEEPRVLGGEEGGDEGGGERADRTVRGRGAVEAIEGTPLEAEEQAVGARGIGERGVALHGAGGIHVSFDMDAVDPLEAPGVGTPWPGGLTYREAHLAMELLADTGLVTSMEVAEVNPIHDHENRTAKLAAELILSALGRTIA